MDLKTALRLKKDAIVTFVGAGGKTSAMFRLADELVRAGERVVTTTTTRIFNAQMELAPAVVIVEDAWTERHMAALRLRLDEHGHCLVVGADGGGQKRNGIPPALVARLRTVAEYVLVEADGSRLRPLKAPAEHEPVVPRVTTHLVPVAGVDVIGQPLAAEYVHRPELVANVAGVALGSTVTPDIVATMLAHPAGGAKGRPEGTRLIPLINKVEDTTGLERARAVASLLLDAPTVDAALIGAMQQEPPVREVWERIAGIVLAAGESTRYGNTTKQVLPWGDTTLVGHAVQVALRAGLAPVIVVTGYDADIVAAAVADVPVQTVFNPDYAAGQSTSVQCGVAAVSENVGGAVFLMADTPNVTPAVVRRVVEAHRETLAPIVIPTYEGQRGNPVLFDRDLFDGIQTISGDVGGRALFEAYRNSIVRVPVDEPGIRQDVNTADDYERFRP